MSFHLYKKKKVIKFKSWLIELRKKVCKREKQANTEDLSKIAHFDLKYSTYAPPHPKLLIFRNKITTNELEPHVAREADSEISKKLLI